MDQEKQHFLNGGEQYARFRPDYPAELAAELARLCEEHELALDVGCGSGQLTRLLSPYFAEVVGSDSSAGQIQHAVKADNIRYVCEAAEQISLVDHSADLLVVAQAAHWFDLDRFYREARRVLKPGGMIALVSYGVPYLEDAANSVFQQGYWQRVHRFWPAERQHVENGYLDLAFPFDPVTLAPLFIRRALNYRQLTGYIQTWSAYKCAAEQQRTEEFEAFFRNLERAWCPDLQQAKTVTWPISVKAGRAN